MTYEHRYVPSSDAEMTESLISASWAGGKQVRAAAQQHMLNGQVRVAYFNVASVHICVSLHHISHVTARQGRVVIDKFIERDLWRVLSTHGVCLLLLLHVNDAQEVALLVERHGLFCKTLISRIAGGEKLLVVDIRRQAHPK